MYAEVNPYIAARGVVRDGNGNIKHLEIRAGEEITVPTNIADAYKAGYTLGNNGVKRSLGDSQNIQDICFDPNTGDKYGNIFGVQDAALRCVGESCSANEIYYTSTEVNRNTINLNTDKELNTVLDEADNRVERHIAAPPSHTTVQAMSHTAV